jgi:hypothetical protein
VAKPRKRLPQDIVDKWPEVFKDIDIKAIPMQYLHSVRVEFGNGKIWDILVKDQNSKADPIKKLEKTLHELLKTYDNNIKHIDFRVDTDRVKKDVQKRTKGFLKKNK